jgi:hypothetical protein
MAPFYRVMLEHVAMRDRKHPSRLMFSIDIDGRRNNKIKKLRGYKALLQVILQR